MNPGDKFTHKGIEYTIIRIEKRPSCTIIVLASDEDGVASFTIQEFKKTLDL